MPYSPEWKTPRGRYWHRWEDNIRMAVRETGWEGVDWIHVTKDKGHCGLL